MAGEAGGAVLAPTSVDRGVVEVGDGVGDSESPGVVLGTPVSPGPVGWSSVAVGVTRFGGGVGVGVLGSVGLAVGVAVGVADGEGVGGGIGLGVGTPPWHVTSIVAGHVAIVARTVRSPSAAPNRSVVLVFPRSLVTLRVGDTESPGERGTLTSQMTSCPATTSPVSALRTVAVITAELSHLTMPEGPSKWTT
ncbi:MAG: hypothetical protein WD830_06055 [Chloroflexota bacterium]